MTNSNRLPCLPYLQLCAARNKLAMAKLWAQVKPREDDCLRIARAESYVRQAQYIYNDYINAGLDS